MGIYIKGMDMPTYEQGDLVLRVRCDGRVDKDYSGNTVATAVPVPPHGRLIEKSALFDKCYQHYEDFMWGKVDGKTALLNIEKEIKAAPTIIEAEGE